jgi:hypothetical protein
MSNSENAINAIQDSIQSGRYLERKKLIMMLQNAVDTFPHLTVGETLPSLIEVMSKEPAPQSFIDMKKAQIKLGLDDDAFKEHLLDGIRRMTNES